LNASQKHKSQSYRLIQFEEPREEDVANLGAFPKDGRTV